MSTFKLVPERFNYFGAEFLKLLIRERVTGTKNRFFVANQTKFSKVLVKIQQNTIF